MLGQCVGAWDRLNRAFCGYKLHLPANMTVIAKCIFRDRRGLGQQHDTE